MLQQFLRDNRAELVDRCREKVAQRSVPGSTAIRLEHGIPIFLEQLIGSLASSEPGEANAVDEMGLSATRHGAELFRNDFTIEQVVHDYGDLCQAIMELAIERKTTIGVGEFQVLNRALDNAIADAVTEYSSGASIMVADRRWNLRLKNGIDVRLPESNVEQALDRLVALDHEKKILSRDILAIDLRLSDRVTVRLSDAAAAAREEALKDKKKKKGGEA